MNHEHINNNRGELYIRMKKRRLMNKGDFYISKYMIYSKI